jgi:hypothetical protein
MLATLIYLIQQPDFQEKLKNAPLDYKIAFFISSYLPYIILIGIAYFIYYKVKNRKDLDD